MKAECIDANVLRIALAHGRGAIVGLEDMPKVVILQSEDASIGAVAAGAPFLAEAGGRGSGAVPAGDGNWTAEKRIKRNDLDIRESMMW